MRQSTNSVDRLQFPSADWNGSLVTFFPSETLKTSDYLIKIALVFAFDKDRIAVAEIQGRGLCIPGGHLKPQETAEDAARREAMEEAGISLGPLSLAGNFIVVGEQDHLSRLIPCFMADILEYHSIPKGSESSGIELLRMHELPARYYMWDQLLENVFLYVFSLH